MKAFLDFIPLLVFFYLFKTEDVFVATQGLLLSTTAVYALHFGMQKGKLEKIQWVTLFLTVGFCALKLILHNDLFIRWKSTVINWLFALVLVAGNYIHFGKSERKPLTERALGKVFEMPHTQWRKLAWIWAVYFLVMGVLHLWFAFVWKDYWAIFKLISALPLTILFMIANFVYLKQYLKHPQKPE